ncbi:MAG: hypothetical protein GXP55_07360 [Deltaproteobacteria bacterium]|nr:hypothetical protein [Deltaproteobacteria bacterium]
MKRRTVLLEDGTPEAAALGDWLARDLMNALRVSAISASDIRTVITARRAAGVRERLVGLTMGGATAADIDGSAATEVVREWLVDLGPFERRCAGPARIEEAVQQKRRGAEELLSLRARVSVRPGVSSQSGSRPRGRPRGTQRPLRGVGFDVSVCLLLHPERGYTERALAEAIGRSSYGVHRVLLALEAAGLVERGRGAIRARDPVLLADALLRDWKQRHQRKRPGQAYACVGGKSARGALGELAAMAGVHVCLAGPSALESRLVGGSGAITLYAEGLNVELAKLHGLRAIERGLPDVIAWRPPERGVLLEPDASGDLPATNAVVTWLDAMASGDDRVMMVAEDQWTPS